jgi:large subunit ribosomal protein L9
MKILLIKDVYKLGRAGDIKKVADGYGRNFLLPQGLAVLATPGALRQVDRIREDATKRRAALNQELGSVAEVLSNLTLEFAVKAGETGKMYGSITSQDIADSIKEKTGVEVKRQQVDLQSVRELGDYIATIRLTIDLVPEVRVVVYREGDVSPLEAEAETEEKVAPSAQETVDEVVAEEAPAEETTAEG